MRRRDFLLISAGSLCWVVLARLPFSGAATKRVAAWVECQTLIAAFGGRGRVQYFEDPRLGVLIDDGLPGCQGVGCVRCGPPSLLRPGISCIVAVGAACSNRLMQRSPYLDEILGRPATGALPCSKCGGSRFFTRHHQATPAVKFWRWTLMPALPEHLRYTCSTCGYSFTASVGTYKVKSNNG